MSHPAIALLLHARLGRPAKGLGICLAVVREIEDMLTRAVVQAQRMEPDEFRAVPADYLAKQLLREAAQPGSAKDADCPEVWW